MIDGGRDASVCHMSLRNVAACAGDLDEIFPALDWLHYTLKASGSLLQNMRFGAEHLHIKQA